MQSPTELPFSPARFSIRPLEWMRYCPVCDSEQVFVATCFVANGLLGKCAKCDDERVVPYTRTNSEAA